MSPILMPVHEQQPSPSPSATSTNRDSDFATLKIDSESETVTNSEQRYVANFTSITILNFVKHT